MRRISPETLRELDARELAVCQAGQVLDALEESDREVCRADYSRALAAWKRENTALTEVRDAILATLSA